MTSKERLKKIRGHLNNISQQKLADAIGFKVTTINHIENGTQKSMSYELAYLLEQKYGFNVHWSMTGVGEMLLTPQKPQKQIEFENALKNYETFAERLNYIEAEFDMNTFSKSVNISSSRLDKLGTGKEEPTLEELKLIKDYVKTKGLNVSLDLLVYGDVVDISQKELTPEVLKALETLKKSGLV